MATQAEFVTSLKNGVTALQERARGLSDKAEVSKRVSAVQQKVLGGTAGALRWQADGLVKLAGSLEGWANKLEEHPGVKAPATTDAPKQSDASA